MSGWIKFEKALREDMRVKRMASAFQKRYCLFDVTVTSDFDPCNACALPSVTLVLGCLAQLWMHADSFARDDDTIDISADEIDEIAGIKGFAEILPADWLQILDQHSVKLPGFQAHNGTDAKRRALGTKRVALHRDNEKKRSTITPSNGHALPDQTKTRPDKTRPEKSKSLSRDRAHDTPPEFSDIQAIYPERAGSQGWSEALIRCLARLKEGSTWEEMLEGARRYQRYVKACENTGTQYVKTAAVFFGPKKFYLEEWREPANKAEIRRESNIDVSREWLSREQH